jgi:LmbE family N-acetylglucosaminyl deacetylase
MIARKAIVFAPHPDDETLACGGTIVKKIREGYDVHIVVLTDGRHSYDLVLGLKEPCPETMKGIRAAECSRATKTLGVNPDNLVLLDFEDSKLAQHTAEAKERIVRILQEILPDEVYVPYRDDEHEDHRATYKIVTDSITDANLQLKIYEYPMWGEKAPHSELKDLSVNISDELPRKMEAISAYQSQISTCFPEQKKPPLSKRFVKTFSSPTETFFTQGNPNN